MGNWGETTLGRILHGTKEYLTTVILMTMALGALVLLAIAAFVRQVFLVLTFRSKQAMGPNRSINELEKQDRS